jgi:hypothetical protein
MTSTQLRSYRAGQILGVPGGVCVVVTSLAEWCDELTCGGEALVDERPVPCSLPAGQSGDDVRPGDRLRDRASGLELRCIRGGRGPVLHGDRPMVRTFW